MVVSRKLWKNKLLLVGMVGALVYAVMAAFPYWLAPMDPYTVTTADQLQPPSPQHPLGTDNLGRDLLSRVIWGSRNSLLVAGSALAVCLIVGGALGLLGGYYGGVWDILLGRVMDIVYSVPPMALAVIIAGLLGPGMKNAILALGLVYIPVFYRVVRAGVMIEKEKEYVTGAIAQGASSFRVMCRHILPNALPSVIVQASITLAQCTILEATLSFLGLGTQPPHPSWGTILNEGRMFLKDAPWLSIVPGVAIFGAVWAFQLIGDGLRDAIDPRLRGLEQQL